MSSKMTPEKMMEKGRELIKKARQQEEQNRNKKFVELGRFLADQEAAGFGDAWEIFHGKLSELLGHEAATPFWVDRFEIPAPKISQTVAEEGTIE